MAFNEPNISVDLLSIERLGVLFDEDDRLFLSNFLWNINADGYCVTSTRKRMHRLIMTKKLGDLNSTPIDHINQNKIDNRKSNLRLATVTQNNRNRSKSKKSKFYKGVRRHRGKWQAYITVGKKRTTIGSFESLELAALAYDIYAEKYFAEFASFNLEKRQDEQTKQVLEILANPKKLTGTTSSYKWVYFRKPSWIAKSRHFKWAFHFKTERDGDFLNIEDATREEVERVREIIKTTKNRKISRSPFKGVYKTRSGNWISRIGINGKKVSLGTFQTQLEAVIAYNNKAKELGRSALNDINLF